ncbi:thylakoid lumenal 16.5 kDa protein, chloroplastic [Andrographis paniculata]|uniref:thylakoid lumenal 16.5 kDa protein, chloroplastic n=1 Tax=Andrographis paniculata TaxID=175694 RepID=UPI0021E8987A|nr:thylakoid lumenal 16.5 kDa protein, chloroplastic [Andrographis paniculata]
MATVFFSNAKLFAPSISPPHRQMILCRSAAAASEGILFDRRTISVSLTIAAASTLIFTGLNNNGSANAAILEADDDQELLEKVKEDRKKRIERQGVISSSAVEKANLQDLVYKLSKIGQAIEKNDLSTASSVLGSSSDAEWVKKVNAAMNKLSYSKDEKAEVDAFSSSLESLISSVSKNDIEASKVAFVLSASSFERWTALSGLADQLKGL